MDTTPLHRSRADLLADGITDDELRTARRRGAMPGSDQACTSTP